jgi:ribosome-binding ATPase
VRGNCQTQRLEVVRRRTKCLHFYFYYQDPELGFIHIRLQSWFPFQIQVYVNGRNCLARYLDQQGIAYQRYDNSFTYLSDLPAAQSYCEQFAHFEWPGVLNALAERVNPVLNIIR